MERKRLENGKTHVIKKGGEEVSANQFGAGVKPADVMWVKIHGGSWWPAQVVDEDTISACNTPSNKSAGEVLVRLYGSYTYLYVDPVKSLDEFDKILKQNNGSYREIFLKALEQEVPYSKDGKSKRQGSKSKANVSVDASSCKSSHSYDKENQEVDASDFVSSHSKRQPNTVILQTEVKKRKLLSRRGKEENNKASKPRGVKSDIASGKKEVKRKLLSRRGKEENNKASKPRGVKSDIASGKKEVKRKSSMQDLSPKKVKISSSAKNDKGKSSKQGGVLKNSKLRGSNNQAEGRSRALKHDVLQKKRKLDAIRPAEKSRSKTSRQKVLKNSKQDELHKNVKPNGARNVSGRRQNDKQNDVRKKRKPNDSSIEDDERKRTPKHDKMLKQHKEKTSVAESQEPSARRLRVMQSLGLIAPPGSPFLKNGHIAPVS